MDLATFVQAGTALWRLVENGRERPKQAQQAQQPTVHVELLSCCTWTDAENEAWLR